MYLIKKQLNLRRSLNWKKEKQNKTIKLPWNLPWGKWVNVQVKVLVCIFSQKLLEELNLAWQHFSRPYPVLSAVLGARDTDVNEESTDLFSSACRLVGEMAPLPCPQRCELGWFGLQSLWWIGRPLSIWNELLQVWEEVVGKAAEGSEVNVKKQDSG